MSIATGDVVDAPEGTPDGHAPLTARSRATDGGVCSRVAV